MPFAQTGTLAGLSRADGTTARTVTMTRVANTKDGFVMRELGVSPNIAQTLTHKTWETKSAGGLMIRHQSTEWQWNYVDPAASDPLALAGRVIWNRNGLHVPANCPTNVRKDIRNQLTGLASGTAGTIGVLLITDPLQSEVYPF